MTSSGADHLVVFASDLATGVQWCEEQLGVTPAAGGEHPLMGTHNRLLNVSSAAHPRAYLEIIAIHTGSPKSIPESARRWFDMDDAFLQKQVSTDGPQLIAWAAAVSDVAAASAALQRRGLDCGLAIRASRPTPGGLLTWNITVRSDGQRLMQGCVPTLIEWGNVHPCDQLPASGVQLQRLELAHPKADALQQACAALGLGAIPVRSAHFAQLQACLTTPYGEINLHSPTPDHAR